VIINNGSMVLMLSNITNASPAKQVAKDLRCGRWHLIKGVMLILTPMPTPRTRTTIPYRVSRCVRSRVWILISSCRWWWRSKKKDFVRRRLVRACACACACVRACARVRARVFRWWRGSAPGPRVRWPLPCYHRRRCFYPRRCRRRTSISLSVSIAGDEAAAAPVAVAARAPVLGFGFGVPPVRVATPVGAWTGFLRT